MHGAESLSHARDARENLTRQRRGVARRLELAKAVVARAAVSLVVAVAEVLGQMPVPAADARRVLLHLPKERTRRVGQLAVGFQHHSPLHEVSGRVDQQALRLETIAARSPGLLLVVLNRPRGASVHDEPHV